MSQGSVSRIVLLINDTFKIILVNYIVNQVIIWLLIIKIYVWRLLLAQMVSLSLQLRIQMDRRPVSYLTSV